MFDEIVSSLRALNGILMSFIERNQLRTSTSRRQSLIERYRSRFSFMNEMDTVFFTTLAQMDT